MKTYAYDAFGNSLPTSPTANGQPPVIAQATATLCGGEAYDPALAAYYLRATRYHRAAGRFTSLDPYAGAAVVPANLQRFAYAGQASIPTADLMASEPVETVSG